MGIILSCNACGNQALTTLHEGRLCLPDDETGDWRKLDEGGEVVVCGARCQRQFERFGGGTPDPRGGSVCAHYDLGARRQTLYCLQDMTAQFFFGPKDLPALTTSYSSCDQHRAEVEAYVRGKLVDFSRNLGDPYRLVIVPLQGGGHLDKIKVVVTDPTEIDDRIDAWHAHKYPGKKIHEVLGWTFEEYGAWVVNPKAIPPESNAWAR